MQINGKKVVDPKRPILLQINDADVAGGRKKKPDACAAAKACVRQLGALSAKVHVSRVYVEFPDKWIRLRTPIALRTEIVSFDRGHKFEAGEYNLIPLQPTIRLGKGNAGSGTGKPRGKGKKVPQRGRRSKAHVVSGIRSHASGWAREK